MNQTLDRYFVDSKNMLLFVWLLNAFHYDILYDLVLLKYTEPIFCCLDLILLIAILREVNFFQYYERKKSAGLNSKQDVLDLSPLAISHPQTFIFTCLNFQYLMLDNKMWSVDARLNWKIWVYLHSVFTLLILSRIHTR